MVNTIAVLLSDVRRRFEEASLDSPEADARLLMQHVLGLSREEMFLKQDVPVDEPRAKLLEQLVVRRLKREPVSRIVGTRSFWKSDFRISADTLDPRPDSEVLIETVLRYPKGGAARILDLGTGSGCLLLSLLQELPFAAGVGVDISADAIRTAQENAKSLGLSRRVKFVARDWSEARFDKPFDIVISNPPYISDQEMKGLAPEVALYDPARALRGGPDGLDCYRGIINLLPIFLKVEGYVFFEIGHTQAKAVKELLEQAGLTVLETAPDLERNDRCIAARATGLSGRER
jgi:release factor glutamine methyltransferase